MSYKKTYKCWWELKARCTDPSHPAYADYGGRGITHCNRWDRFENFLADMGVCPVGLTLDRIDNNAGYSRENCRWVTMKEQARNRRSNHLLEHKGEVLCISEWAERLGIKKSTIKMRLEAGWSTEKALTHPVRCYNRS